MSVSDALTPALIARLEAAGHDDRLSTGALYLEAADALRAASERTAPLDWEQLNVQLAGCLTAAEGHTAPEHIATPEMYGWSLAYQKVLELRLAYDALRARSAAPTALPESEVLLRRWLKLAAGETTTPVDMTEADTRAYLAARPSLAPPPEGEMWLRQQLWLRHGHRGIYGDDGEMQCGECRGLDFKRDSVEQIRKAMHDLDVARMTASLAPASGAQLRRDHGGSRSVIREAGRRGCSATGGAMSERDWSYEAAEYRRDVEYWKKMGLMRPVRACLIAARACEEMARLSSNVLTPTGESVMQTVADILGVGERDATAGDGSAGITPVVSGQHEAAAPALRSDAPTPPPEERERLAEIMDGGHRCHVDGGVLVTVQMSDKNARRIASLLRAPALSRERLAEAMRATFDYAPDGPEPGDWPPWADRVLAHLNAPEGTG